MAATSFVRDRGRALGVVALLTASVALASAPAASGAVDGDPIATSVFNVKFSKGFKKQLKRNGVKMKPKRLKLRGKNDVDPTTGQADLRLKTVTFKLKRKGVKKCKRKAETKRQAKKCKKKVKFSNLKGSLPGNLKGRAGKLFKLTAPKSVVRNGFGANLSGIKVKFLKRAAKKINKTFNLGSLRARRAGRMTLSYQPQTVKVLGGTMLIDTPVSYLPPTFPGGGGVPNSVAARLQYHCVSPAGGASAIAPGQLATITSPNPNVGPLPSGVAARFKFPITGGTVSPAGNDGVINSDGGIKLQTGTIGGIDTALFPQPAACQDTAPGPSTSNSSLENTLLSPDLALGKMQANATLGGLMPGCIAAGNPPQCQPSPSCAPAAQCAVIPGPKGPALGQDLAVAGATVAADPAAKTVAISNLEISNNATAVTVLGGPGGAPAGLFPNATSPYDASRDFVAGDKFGLATMNLNVR